VIIIARIGVFIGYGYGYEMGMATSTLANVANLVDCEEI
jgi:hypothetical protein